jgi:hypothetical protein
MISSFIATAPQFVSRTSPCLLSARGHTLIQGNYVLLRCTTPSTVPVVSPKARERATSAKHGYGARRRDILRRTRRVQAARAYVAFFPLPARRLPALLLPLGAAGSTRRGRAPALRRRGAFATGPFALAAAIFAASVLAVLVALRVKKFEGVIHACLSKSHIKISLNLLFL